MINYTSSAIIGFLLVVFYLYSCSQPQTQADHRIGVIDGAIILDAIQDFEIDSTSRNVAYCDTVRGVLAIDVMMHMDTFAQAEYISREQSQVYDIQLFTMLETDGESVYTVNINDVRVGEFYNPTTRTDFLLHVHRVDKVQIDTGDTIKVGFGSATNNKTQLSDGHEYAQGRWSKLILTPSK